MTRTEQTALTAKVRREIKAELTYAIENRMERGTVVTSAGRWFPFTIRYATLMSGKEVAAVTLLGRKVYGAADAASTALSLWGFTR